VSEPLPLAAAAIRLRRAPGRPRTIVAAPQEQPALSPRLLDLAGTARYLGMSEWTVRGLEAAGVLRRVRIPLPNGGELRKLLFDRENLDKLVDSWKHDSP
jgi:hypothetical protein